MNCDIGNDIEMLNYCGYSYAMENASEDVKAAAKFVWCGIKKVDSLFSRIS